MANPGVANSSVINLLPVQAEYDANGNCLGLFGQGGNALVAPLTATTLNHTVSTSLNGYVTEFATAPTIASGFGTSPTLIANNTAAFAVIVGTGGAATGTISLPVAPNGWAVACQDVTSYATVFAQQSASTTTSVSVTGYSVTTGLATNFNAGDRLVFTATAY